jgi:hypothetical protein
MAANKKEYNISIKNREHQYSSKRAGRKFASQNQLEVEVHMYASELAWYGSS